MFTVWVYRLQDVKRNMADWINFASQLSSSVESSKQKSMVITTLSRESNKNTKNVGAMQHIIQCREWDQ